MALALWNGRDPIIKERRSGLTNSEGNHGEDVKEYYFYLDSTPTHSYLKWLYKNPQGEYPYGDLVATIGDAPTTSSTTSAFLARPIRARTSRTASIINSSTGIRAPLTPRVPAPRQLHIIG